MEAEGDLEPGRVLAGQFRIRRKLGEGGMGAMYLAEQLEIERLVAIKVVHGAMLSLHPQLLDRFKREARALAQIRHENVVQLYALGHTDRGLPFLAMEYVAGRTLEVELRAGPLPLREALDVALQVAEALGEAHRSGVIHRDLKPANIMLSEPEQPGVWLVKVVDFGIAKTLDSPESLTLTGAFFGTPQYVSPEQARSRAIDARSDIYTLGLVLYEMLTGRSPFLGKTPFDLLAQQVAQRPEPPSQRRRSLPASIDAIVLRCLEKLPEDRFASAPELADALRRARTAASRESDAPRASLAAEVVPAVSHTPWVTSRGGTGPREAVAAQGSAAAGVVPVANTPWIERRVAERPGSGPSELRALQDAPRLVSEPAPRARLRRTPRWPLYAACGCALFAVVLLFVVGSWLWSALASLWHDATTSADAHLPSVREMFQDSEQTSLPPREVPESSGEPAALRELVVECLNATAAPAQRARALYVSWAGLDHTLATTKAILGVAPLPETAPCADAAQAAAQSLDPPLRAAADSFAEAARQLAARTTEAASYYGDKAHESDDRERARALHPQLIAAFDTFSDAERALRALLEPRITALERERFADTESLSDCDRQIAAVWRHSRALAMLANRSWRSVAFIDLPGYSQALATLDSNVARFSTACKLGVASRMLDAAAAQVAAAKLLRRRIAADRSFDARERRQLERGAGHLVRGSPSEVVAAHQQVVSWLNQTDLLRKANLGALAPLAVNP